MISKLVYLAVWLSAARAQNSWPYPFQQQLPPPGQLTPQQQNGFPTGFVPLGSNGLQQPFDGFNYGNRPIFNAGPSQPIPQPIPPPRMQLLRIQLLCETIPAQQPPMIRWVRRDSSTVASTAITIADGANAVDPLQYAVNLENLPNGATRSVLTILKPEPDSSQAAYYCQSVSSRSFTAESREVYVIGNRQFVNANMAYHAADTIKGYWQQRSAGPATEAVRLVTPNSIYLNASNWLIYHGDEKRSSSLRTHNLTLPSIVEESPVVLDKTV